MEGDESTTSALRSRMTSVKVQCQGVCRRVERTVLGDIDTKDKKNRAGLACSICCGACGVCELMLATCIYFIISAIFVWAILDNAVITNERRIDALLWEIAAAFPGRRAHIAQHCLGYDFWLTNIGGVSPPMYECFHMFNLTNLPTVQQGGKPVYEEVGPYCYVIQKTKFDVNWEDDGNTVSHSKWQYYVFSEKMSVGDPDEDIFVNLSAGYLGIVMVLRGEELIPIVLAGTVMGANVGWMTTSFVYHMQANQTATLLPAQQNIIISGGTSSADFYSIWANSTTAPSAAWDGMLVSFEGTASGIPSTVAEQLFDPSTPYSLVNSEPESVSAWLNASLTATPVTNVTTGEYLDATLDSWSFLADEFGITEEQVEMVGTWLRESFYVTYTDPLLVDTYAALDENVLEVTDIGWLQWGSCNVISQTERISAADVFHFEPEGIPEYACLEENAHQFGVAESKELLVGEYGVVELPNLVTFIGTYADAIIACPTNSTTQHLTDCTSCMDCASDYCVASMNSTAAVCAVPGDYGCSLDSSFSPCTVTAGDGICTYDGASGTCTPSNGTACALTNTTDACDATGGAVCSYNAITVACDVTGTIDCSYDSYTSSCISSDGSDACQLEPQFTNLTDFCTYLSVTDTCFSSNSTYVTCTASSSNATCDGTVSCGSCSSGVADGSGHESYNATDCSSCTCSNATTPLDIVVCDSCELCANYTRCDDVSAWTVFYDKWGLDKNDTLSFFAYMVNTTEEHAQGMLQKMFDHNGGLWKTMTVNEWLFYPDDPLMRVVEPLNPHDGYLVTNFTTQEEAAQHVLPSKEYTGKNDVSQLAWYINYQNKTEIKAPTYAVDIPVYGQDEWGQFQPFMKERGIDHMYMFDPNYYRPLELIKKMEVQYRDITLWRYMISNKTWAPNPDYYMEIPGFTNMTGIENSPVFFSIPHWQGVPDEYAAKVDGVVEGRDWRVDYSVIDMEPHTGLVFHTNASLMVNIYIDDEMGEWLSVYNPGIPTDTFYPIMWAYEEALLSKGNAFEFTLLVNMMLWLQKFLVGLCLFAGVLMLLAAGFIYHYVRNMREPNWAPMDFDATGVAAGDYGDDTFTREETSALLDELDREK